MRIRVCSDLHIDLLRDFGASLLGEICSDPDYDVLVVAGDLAENRSLGRAFAALDAATEGRPIVYVLGNHDYWRSPSRAAAVETARELAHGRWIYVLERETVTLDGIRFVGATLWFRHSRDRDVIDAGWPDFVYVPGLMAELPDYARESAEYLAETVRSGDVVVTHHLPHPNSISSKYRGNAGNRFFLHNVGPIVETAGAALWIHGHTHIQTSYDVGSTHVECNPVGYMDEISYFNPHLTVTL